MDESTVYLALESYTFYYYFVQHLAVIYLELADGYHLASYQVRLVFELYFQF